jgi:hypothetical protein
LGKSRDNLQRLIGMANYSLRVQLIMLLCIVAH